MFDSKCVIGKIQFPVFSTTNPKLLYVAFFLLHLLNFSSHFINLVLTYFQFDVLCNKTTEYPLVYWIGVLSLIWLLGLFRKLWIYEFSKSFFFGLRVLSIQSFTPTFLKLVSLHPRSVIVASMKLTDYLISCSLLIRFLLVFCLNLKSYPCT